MTNIDNQDAECPHGYHFRTCGICNTNSKRGDIVNRTELCQAALEGVANTILEHALLFKDEFERLSILRDGINIVLNRMVEQTRRRRDEQALPIAWDKTRAGY